MYERSKFMPDITYTLVGDYFLPDITLQELPPHGAEVCVEPLTRYGMMRKNFLKEHRTISYNRMLLSEELYPHCREVQQDTHRRFDRLMSDILVFRPPPDKNAHSLAWAAHMTEIHRLAEKMMLDEIVYA